MKIGLLNVLQIAENAGDLILGYYKNEEYTFETKNDGSPVGQADIASHNYIYKSLNEVSSWPIISEELPVNNQQRLSWKKFWLVDPLDGTKDFLAHNDEFTVNIALIEDSKPILGVVHIPALKVTYYAAKGEGAFKKDKNIISTVSSLSERQELICLESRFHSSPHTEKLCRALNIKKIQKFGSSIKLCKIAEGEADVYPRFEPTKEWDTAAGQSILEEAGGRLIDSKTGKSMEYNKESIINNSFLAIREELELNETLKEFSNLIALSRFKCSYR